MSEANKNPEYKVHLKEPAGLCGRLVIHGDFEDGYGKKKGFAMHFSMSDCYANVSERSEIAKYGCPTSVIKATGYGLISGSYALMENFPETDIISVEGINIVGSSELAKKVGGSGIDRPSGSLGLVTTLTRVYEAQYRKGKLWWSFMKHIETDLWIPRYWFRTRKIERLRRKAIAAAENRELDLAMDLGQEMTEIKETIEPTCSG